MIRLSPMLGVLLAACASSSPTAPDPMPTKLLTEAEFQATFAASMREITNADGADADDEVNIWPYVDAVPVADLRGHTVVEDKVEHVYRAEGDAHDHVLLPSTTANVFLVIVVDRKARKVLGHHLLDLNEKYGLPAPGRTDKA